MLFSIKISGAPLRGPVKGHAFLKGLFRSTIYTSENIQCLS